MVSRCFGFTFTPKNKISVIQIQTTPNQLISFPQFVVWWLRESAPFTLHKSQGIKSPNPDHQSKPSKACLLKIEPTATLKTKRNCLLTSIQTKRHQLTRLLEIQRIQAQLPKPPQRHPTRRNSKGSEVGYMKSKSRNPTRYVHIYEYIRHVGLSSVYIYIYLDIQNPH